MLKISDIIFGLIYLRWDGMKGYRLSIKEYKSKKFILNIEPKKTKSLTKNIYFLIEKVLKYWTKETKSPYFFLFLSCGLTVFRFSFLRVRYIAEPHTLLHDVSVFIIIIIIVGARGPRMKLKGLSIDWGGSWRVSAQTEEEVKGSQH